MELEVIAGVPGLVVGEVEETDSGSKTFVPA